MIRVNVSSKEALAPFPCKEIEGSKGYVSSNRRFQDKLNLAR